MNAPTLRAHWFFFVAPLIVVADLHLALTVQGEFNRWLEAGLLLDLMLVVPGLYWLCYRSKGRAAIIKAVALACLGIWVATKLVPEPEQDLLGLMAPLRYLGLAVLLLIEIKLMVAIYRSAFKGDTVEEITAKGGADMPAWAAKLIAMEARFWMRVWAWVKRIGGPSDK
jgi:hypothetical protein